jgi:hypothetical protein
MKVGAIGKSKPVSGNSEPPPPAEQEHAEAEEHDQERRPGFLVVEEAEQDEEQHETVQPIYQAWGAATDAERKQFAEQHWAEVARSARRQLKEGNLIQWVDAKGKELLLEPRRIKRLSRDGFNIYVDNGTGGEMSIQITGCVLIATVG